MAAMEKALALPEPREAILKQLPLRDLLLAQRINRTFKADIEQSPDLQKLLFFKAIDGTKELHLFNGLGSEHIIHHYGTLSPVGAEFTRYIGLRVPREITDITLELDDYDWTPDRVLLGLGTHDDRDDRADKFERWNCPEASFRRMFASQPPVQFLDVHVDYFQAIFGDHKIFPHPSVTRLYNGNGVTAGQIWDATMKARRSYKHDGVVMGYFEKPGYP